MAMEQLDAETARAITSVLRSASPRSIFDELERLRVDGKIEGKDFEKLLTDFFWLFCY
ncbi:MAG: hypothetical protein WCS01_07130 [bacterium]